MDEQKKKEGIPLWTFLAIAGGIGVCVGGYFYLKKRATMSALVGLDASRFMPPVEAARDAFAQALPSACACGRDLDIRPAAPRAAAKYILSGF